MEQGAESRREGGRGWVGGKSPTEDLVCMCAWLLDTDNGGVRAWGVGGVGRGLEISSHSLGFEAVCWHSLAFNPLMFMPCFNSVKQRPIVGGLQRRVSALAQALGWKGSYMSQLSYRIKA